MDWHNISQLNGTCEIVDYGLSRLLEMRGELREQVVRPEPINIVPASVLVVVAFVVLGAGARLVRVAASVAAFMLAFYVTYSFVRDSSESIRCDARLVAASVSGLGAALVAGCVVRIGLFLIGAAAFAGLMHLTFAAFPSLDDGEGRVAGRSYVYWILLVAAGVAGGLLVRWHDKPLLEIVTACVGGAALAYGVRAIFAHVDVEVERWSYLVIAGVASLAGALVQRRVRLAHKQRAVVGADRV